MKKTIIMQGIILGFILGLSGLVMAADHATIGVSCSIPVVPGLNAPLNEETSVEASSSQKTMENPNENSSSQIIKTTEEIQLAENISQTITVQTIYSR